MGTSWHLKSSRKVTGGRVRKLRKKKKRDRGMTFLETRVAPKKTRPKRSRGGFIKTKLLSEEVANIANSRGKIKKARILNVKESPANPHYIRRNVLTKGAIIETEAGVAKVTSKPGQHGVINAVLIEEKKPGK